MFCYYFTGSLDHNGFPRRFRSKCDFSSSMVLHLFAGIMSGKGGSGINPGMLGGIFKSVMGGGDQGDDEKGNPK